MKRVIYAIVFQRSRSICNLLKLWIRTQFMARCTRYNITW